MTENTDEKKFEEWVKEKDYRLIGGVLDIKKEAFLAGIAEGRKAEHEEWERKVKTLKLIFDTVPENTEEYVNIHGLGVVSVPWVKSKINRIFKETK
jgi:hypothetical protein